jgi:hypothetical protein
VRTRKRRIAFQTIVSTATANESQETAVNDDSALSPSSPSPPLQNALSDATESIATEMNDNGSEKVYTVPSETAADDAQTGKIYKIEPKVVLTPVPHGNREIDRLDAGAIIFGKRKRTLSLKARIHRKHKRKEKAKLKRETELRKQTDDTRIYDEDDSDAESNDASDDEKSNYSFDATDDDDDDDDDSENCKDANKHCDSEPDYTEDQSQSDDEGTKRGKIAVLSQALRISLTFLSFWRTV